MMLMQSIYLEDWDWHAIVFYAVDTCYTDSILAELKKIDCSEKKLYEIERSLNACLSNTGITYSNLKDRCSVIVISPTTSPAEFQNTFDHEKGHLAMHICEADKIDPFSEEYQYLTGEIGQLMFPVAKRFLCEHCRAELQGEI